MTDIAAEFVCWGSIIPVGMLLILVGLWWSEHSTDVWFSLHPGAVEAPDGTRILGRWAAREAKNADKFEKWMKKGE